MKKFVYIIFASVLLGVFIMPSASAQWNLFQDPMVGKAAEDFSLKNLSGQTQDFSKLHDGQAAIIFFWATWCPHCRKSLTQLSANAQKIKQENIQLVLVDLGEKSSDVTKYLKGNNISLGVLLDGNGEVAGQYGVQGIPTFVYVDKNGIVKAVEHQLLDDYEKVLGVQ